MRFRSKVNKNTSKKLFRRTAGTKRTNFKKTGVVKRGGTRM